MNRVVQYCDVPVSEWQGMWLDETKYGDLIYVLEDYVETHLERNPEPLCEDGAECWDPACILPPTRFDLCGPLRPTISAQRIAEGLAESLDEEYGFDGSVDWFASPGLVAAISTWLDESCANTWTSDTGVTVEVDWARDWKP